MQRIELSTPCDLSFVALHHAAVLLGEAPSELRVTSADHRLARQITAHLPAVDIAVVLDGRLNTGEWLLTGATREVHSAGV